jgi:hypothetical protein
MAFPTLTNADIVIASPLLIADYVSKASSGSSTTAVSYSLRGLDEHEIIGSYICFLNGDNAGVDRIITDYTSTNDAEFEFDALDYAVDNTTTFAVVLIDYTAGVDRAKTIITNDLKRKGYDINNFLVPDDLRELLLIKTMSHIFQSKRQDANDTDMYHIAYLEFEEDYKEELNSLIADYDANENGTIDTDEENFSAGQIRFER